MNRFVLLGSLAALPLTLFAGTLQTVTLDVKNMTLCGLSNHRQKSSGEGGGRHERHGRFR
jgi:hypothetical protein